MRERGGGGFRREPLSAVGTENGIPDIWCLVVRTLDQSADPDLRAGPLDDVEAEVIGLADDLAPPHPTAGHRDIEGHRIMISPAARVDARRAAEFAHPHNQR